MDLLSIRLGGSQGVGIVIGTNIRPSTAPKHLQLANRNFFKHIPYSFVAHHWSRSINIRKYG